MTVVTESSWRRRLISTGWGWAVIVSGLSVLVGLALGGFTQLTMAHGVAWALVAGGVILFFVSVFNLMGGGELPEYRYFEVFGQEGTRSRDRVDRVPRTSRSRDWAWLMIGSAGCFLLAAALFQV
jgi:hypothetical protein